jgi:hypothetical protein
VKFLWIWTVIVSMAYRFIIAVDIDADDLKSAYGKLYHFMGQRGPGVGWDRKDLDWESTDENYDDDGEEIDPDVMQKARMEVFKDPYYGNTGDVYE